MCPEETEQSSLSEPKDPTETLTDTSDLTPSPQPIHRRRFLTAAALGSAAAMMLSKGKGTGLRLGPQSVLADTLSNVNCTANDVRIIGPGVIVNEPCNCSGTFTARVKFRVNNNTGTDRYCVTVHFCPATLPGGGTFSPGDVIIGTIPPGEDDYFADIPNYPCGAGLVCFGAAGSNPDGSFAKGETCPTGQCCTAISWNVRPNDGCPQPHDRIIKSKCRAQQICIQGRGAVLECLTNCTPDCGGTATLRLCATGGVAPYTFSLSDGTNTLQPTSVSGNCATFTVTVTQTTTFTGTVTDSDSPPCPQQSNAITLTVTPVQTPTLVQTSANCAGVVVLTATAVGGNQTGDQFIFGGASGTVSGNTITLQPQLDGVCRTVTVKLRRGTCESGEASYSFSQCVTTSAC
jgi:hypothetical protein